MPDPTKYRRKSPTVTVIEFAGQAIPGGFVNDSDRSVATRTTHGMRTVEPGHGLVPTLGGPVPIAPGDKLVTGADGTQAVVVAADFEAEYEPAPAEPTAPTGATASATSLTPTVEK